MEIKIEEISLQEKFSASLDDATKKFQSQYEKFRRTDAEIDFSQKITTGNGCIGYRAIYPNK